MPKRGDRNLQLVENFLALFRGHGFRLFSREPASFFCGERSQIEVCPARQLFVMRSPAFRYNSRSLCHFSLTMQGAGLVEGGDRGLALIERVKLLASSREAVACLVEVALAVRAQSFANRRLRTVGPTETRESHDQDHRDRDGQGGLTGSASTCFGA